MAETVGLSPRVRGNRKRVPRHVERLGSIPACAGEPDRDHRPRLVGGVYPRVCGGTQAVSAFGPESSGLSPRVRGNRERQGGYAVRAGSIPACAGEPIPLSMEAVSSGVYPRVCGGTSICACNAATVPGLSPRVRGNREAIELGTSVGGSIPACAGEPWSGTNPANKCRVYPRVCGGTRVPSGTLLAGGGLSPRVRGNLQLASARGEDVGSIPACAGEPVHSPAASLCAGVYPRVCGGTGPGGLGHLRHVGSIPACAGEPALSSSAMISWKVYPRVCGGTVGRLADQLVALGLSPRVRGNPRGFVRGGARRGSIPACAGEPSRGWRAWRGRWVYPRVCGGTTRSNRTSSPASGLSPRVRGNPCRS